MYVFVYGTLRKGDSRFGVLDECECVAEEAYLDDYYMISLGGFPGILPGVGQVRGEIYKIDEDILDQLDRIEGYREDDPKHSLYIRTVVSPKGIEDGREIMTYVYNDERTSRRDHQIIESGDWFDASPPRVPRSQKA